MINHSYNPLWVHALIKSLYHCHASKSDSPSICPKQLIWFLNCVVLIGMKYLARNTFFNSFHVVMEFDGRDCNWALALSLREKGNRHNRMVMGSMLRHLMSMRTYIYHLQTFHGDSLSSFTPILGSQHSKSVFGTFLGGTSTRVSSSLFVSWILWYSSRVDYWSYHIVPTRLSRSGYFKVRYMVDTSTPKELIFGHPRMMLYGDRASTKR